MSDKEREREREREQGKRERGRESGDKWRCQERIILRIALVIFFFFFFFFFVVALTEWRFSRPRHFPKTERI
jgi:hypothetical protein